MTMVKTYETFQQESRQMLSEATKGLSLEKYESANGKFKYSGKKRPEHLHNWEPETPRKSGVAVLRFLTNVPREARGGTKSVANVWRLEQPNIHRHGVFDEISNAASAGPDSPQGIRELRTSLGTVVRRLEAGTYKKVIVYCAQDTFDKAAQSVNGLSAVRKQIVVEDEAEPAEFVRRDVTKVPEWVTDPEGNPKGYKSGIASVTQKNGKHLWLARTEDDGFVVYTTKKGKLAKTEYFTASQEQQADDRFHTLQL